MIVIGSQNDSHLASKPFNSLKQQSHICLQMLAPYTSKFSILKLELELITNDFSLITNSSQLLTIVS
jgi:hypothetical protein